MEQKNEIRAGFGAVGNTENEIGGWLWSTFEGGFFMFSGAKKESNFLEKILQCPH